MRSAILVVALIAACTRGTAIDAWTLDVAGGPHDVAITLPSNYLNQLPLRPLDYTLRATVPVDPAWRGQPLVLEIDGFNGPLIARANAVVLEDTGDAMVGWHRFEIPVVDRDTLSIELALRRDLYLILGLSTAPVITTAASADTTGSSMAGFNRLAATAALMVGLFLGLLYGAQFVIGRSPETLAVAIWALANSAVVPLLLLGIPGQLFGELTGLFVLYGSVGGVVSYFYFIHLTFDLGPVSRRWFYIFGGIAIPSTASVVAGWMVGAIACWVALNLVIVIANLYGLSRLWRVARGTTARNDAWLVFAFNALYVVLLFAELSTLATGRPPFGPIHPMTVAIALQAVAQAIVVSRRHVRRQREIATANAALQRQVAERSRELGEALRARGAGVATADLATGPAGSLAHLRARFGDVGWARPLLAQIAAQLAALHARGTAHGDLKLAGILVDGTSARIIGADEADTVGPDAAAAVPADDILAFGRIARDVLGGAPGDETMPSAIASLIDRCLAIDPAARPTAAEVVRACTDAA